MKASEVKDLIRSGSEIADLLIDELVEINSTVFELQGLRDKRLVDLIEQLRRHLGEEEASKVIRLVISRESRQRSSMWNGIERLAPTLFAIATKFIEVGLPEEEES